jgi:alpha-glucosidase
MQWNSGPSAGFTTPGAKPWLPIPPDYVTVNVKTEEANPDSLLKWYQALIRLKKANPALATGNDTLLDSQNTNVLSWVREATGAPPVVVAVNFTTEPQTVSLTVPGATGNLRTLLKTPGAADPASLGAIQLGPYGVFIGDVGR